MKITKAGLYRSAAGQIVNIHHVGEVAAGTINNGPNMLWEKETGRPVAPKPRGKHLEERQIVSRIPTIGDRST